MNFRPPLQRAFTLMEMLIAVAACAIILAAIHTVFFGAIRLRNATDEALAQAAPRQRALAIIKRDLANMVPPEGELTGTFKFPPTGISGQMSPDFYTTTGSLSDFTPWPQVQKVVYVLMDSTNGFSGKDLFRSVSRNLLPSTEDQIAYQWLLSGVDRIGFQFYDGSQWRDSWDSSTEEVPMPKGIRVQIEMTTTNEQTLARPLELVVPIMVQSRTNLTEQSEQTETGS